MGKVVVLPKPTRVSATRPHPVLPAQVLLFTGVRYERQGEAAEPIGVRRQLS